MAPSSYRSAKQEWGPYAADSRRAMRAVWLRATAQLRGRVRVSVLLALLVGLAGGLVLAAAGGQPARGAQRNLGLSAHLVSGTDPASPAGPRRQAAVVALDPGGGDLAGRPMVIAGRLPREDRADAAAPEIPGRTS